MKKSLIGLELLNKFHANKMQDIEKTSKRNDILVFTLLLLSIIIPLISENNEYYFFLYMLLMVIFLISIYIYEIKKWEKEKSIYQRIKKIYC